MVDLAGRLRRRASATARTHYENFPVASLLLPRRMRPHVAALYAFARAADDFADEGDRTVDERHRLLDGWRARLHRRGRRRDIARVQRSPEPGEPAHTREIFLALGATIRDCSFRRRCSRIC